jgi:hypothetical protein
LAAVLILAATGCLVVAAADAPAGAPVTTPAGTAASTASTSGNTSAGSQDTINSLAGDSANLQSLQRFLSLPPESLAHLRKALDYLDNMPQADRDALLRDVEARINSIRQLHQEINADLQQLSPSERDVLGLYESTLFPEEIQALIKRFHDTGADTGARKLIIQELLKAAADKGIKATPPNPPGNGARGASTTTGRGRNPSGNGRAGQRPPSAASIAPAPANTTTSP